MRMINWHSLVFILPGFLVYAWPNSTANKDHNELFLRSLHNPSALATNLWQKDACWPESCCWRWLIDLQNTECPFMQLLVHCLIALPIYNLLMFLIGWHLHRSSAGVAERLVLLMKPELVERSQTPRPLAVVQLMAMPSSLPPSPPPRCKRRRAPKPPTRRIRAILCSPDKYPSHKDPFATASSCDAQEDEHYRTLRRNLLRVLEGLQQPLQPMLALPLPMPVAKPELQPCDMHEEPALTESTAALDLSKGKRKSSKWFNTVVKRLGQRFVKSKSRKQCEHSADATVSHRSSSNSNSSSSSRSTSSDSDRSIGSNLQPFWQRLAQRSSASRKSKFYVNSPSSSETNSSASCIYAY